MVTLGSPLARLRTVEFFGVLLPGIFIVASLGFSWVAAHSTSANDLFEQLIEHFSSVPRWYPVIVLVGTAYLLGSVVRAFPVWKLDTPLAKFFWVFVRKGASERMTRLYERDYPYSTLLDFERRHLLNAGCISESSLSKGPDFSKGHAHVSIDYCKEYAASKSAAADARLQEAEARTRMFFGTFCAAAIGAFTSALFALFDRNALPLLWCIPTLTLALLFGQRLRFVRGHEARMIYYAYLIQRETEHMGAAKKSEGAPVESTLAHLPGDGDALR